MTGTAPKLLLIETSAATGSVALAIDGQVEERFIATPREQTGRVLGIVDELLARAGLAPTDLDALVFGRGPGSFTGLRIAAAVTQGLSFAAGRPILAVSSLAAQAQRAFAGGVAGQGAAGKAALRVLCCNDARMGEVFAAVFRLEGGLAVPETDETLGPPGQLAVPAGAFIAVGDAFSVHAGPLAAHLGAAVAVDPDLMPSASDLLPLAAAGFAAGRFVEREAALPVYLRGADAWRRA